MSITGRSRRGNRRHPDISELDRKSFEDCPIWEFTLHEGAIGPNRGSVRPRPDLTTHDRHQGTGVFAVRTIFTYADGEEAVGYCSPIVGPVDPLEHALGYLAPAVVTPSGHVPFWFVGKAKPKSDDIQHLYEKLEREENIFPIAFESDVSVAEDEIGSGTIEGFTYVTYSEGQFAFIEVK